MLEINNIYIIMMTMRKYRYEFILGGLFVLIVSGLIYWFANFEPDSIWKIAIAAGLIILFFIIYLWKGINSQKLLAKNLVVEDEFTKNSRMMAGAKAFHFSLFYWMMLMLFQDSFRNTDEIFGVAILGSAAIYGIALWYYRRSGLSDEE